MCGRRSREGVNWGAMHGHMCFITSFWLYICLGSPVWENVTPAGWIVQFFGFLKRPLPYVLLTTFKRLWYTISSPWAYVLKEQQKDNDILDFPPCPCMHACVCPILGFASSLVWWWQKEVAKKEGKRVSERGREGFVLGCFHFTSFSAIMFPLWKYFLWWWNSLAFS